MTQDQAASYALPTSEIRIYVACLASYNNGQLHGRWIDAAQGEAHIWEGTKAMLAASPQPMAEEWAIHDYEGFKGAPVSEYSSFARNASFAEFIKEHGELGGALIAHYGGDLEDAESRIEDYIGEYESLEDYARQLTEECGIDIPESLRFYIDYTAMGRDMEVGGGIISIDTDHNKIHIFGAG